jgi:hypothetical protein
MEEVLREIEQSTALRNFLRGRVPVGDGPGCAPACSWILEDLELNGRLTGWPLDAMNSPQYPVEGKLLHLATELGVTERLDGVRLRTVRDLVPFIAARVRQLKS